jgi:hypothetical protein
MAAEPAEDPLRWRRLYALVLVVLAVEIALLWAISWAFT